MSNSSKTCSQCGAILPIGTARCSYCGSAARAPKAESSRKIESSLPTGEKNQIPGEFIDLKRPKVQQPLDASVFSLIFALFWTLFSAFFVFVGAGVYLRDLIDYNRLATEGIPTTATITGLETHSSDDSDTYHVYYQFRAIIQGDTTRFQGSDQVSVGSYRQMYVGQNIPIVYWASAPNLSAVKAELGPPGIFLLVCFGGMGGLFTLIGLVMLFSSINSIAYLSRLRLSGRQTQAFIYDRWKDKDSEGDTTYFIAYAFSLNLPGQGPITVTRAEQNKQVYYRYQVGDAVPVRYLPQNPNICQLKIEKQGVL